MIDIGTRKFPEEVLAVFKVLDTNDCDYKVRVFEAPAHHAREAAALVGSSLGAIVKSLVFTNEGHDKYFLILVSGQNRVDKRKLSKIVGEKVFPANPDKVLLVTGYPVGAVPPFGLNPDFPVIVDEELMSIERLWASAGSAYTLVNFESVILEDIYDGWICNIKAI